MSCVWTSAPAWAPKSHTAGGGNEERQGVRDYTWLRIIRDAPLTHSLHCPFGLLFTVTLSLSFCPVLYGWSTQEACAVRVAEPLAIHSAPILTD